MKTKIEIKSLFGELLFSYDKEDNTLKSTIIKAVDSGANLRGADLRGAVLGDANLRGANLRGADLRDADLGGANLRGANLRGANLGGANLRGADLRGAVLGDANLRGANLRGADLRGAVLGDANLGGANLRGADLRDADLGGANLRDADLGGANLRDAVLRDTEYNSYVPLACPSDGSFIGWKKIKRFYLVQLEIPAEAKRCSATTRKCRCDKAMVISITDIRNNEACCEVENISYSNTIYKVGEMVYPDSFDENRWNECSHGIHFFINKQDAIDY